MKHKIYKGGVDNYPLWWYGQSDRLQNFGDRPNFLIPHGAVFQGNGYYFDGSSSYLEDSFGRHLVREGSNGILSYLYLTDGSVPHCGSVIGTGTRLYLSYDEEPKITGNLVLYSKYCPNLVRIYCDNSQISVLDVSQAWRLTDIKCGSNNISKLNVKHLASLAYLSCSVNPMPVLNLSYLTVLARVYCHSMPLVELDVTGCYGITDLECYNCLMDSAMVDQVLCDANAWNTSGGTLDISGNTAPSSTGTDCANDMVNRNWTVTTD